MNTRSLARGVVLAFLSGCLLEGAPTHAQGSWNYSHQYTTVQSYINNKVAMKRALRKSKRRAVKRGKKRRGHPSVIRRTRATTPLAPRRGGGREGRG